MEEKQYVGYVYKITNLVNGKIYVGLKSGSKFVNSYWGSGSLIRKAIAKYGKDNFSREVLAWCYTRDELEQTEIYWIAKLDAMNPEVGYNLTIGGHTTLGYKYSAEQLASKKTRNGQKQSQETKEKISLSIKKYFAENPRPHIPHTDETKQKIGAAHKGKTTSQETRDKLSAALSGENSPLYGVPLTEEHKQNISKNRKGKCCGPDHQDFGKHQTAERRANIGKANSGRIYINNGEITKHVKLEDVQSYLEQGWVVGRILSEKHKAYIDFMKGEGATTHGTKWINDGEVNKMVKLCEVQTFLDKGWQLGMLRKHKNTQFDELRNEFEPQYDGGAPF